MFKCKECSATEFQLVVQPRYDGQVSVRCNEFREVIVSAGGREFVADLMFMNQFAVCQQCGAIKSWEYFFREGALAM